MKLENIQQGYIGHYLGIRRVVSLFERYKNSSRNLDQP